MLLCALLTVAAHADVVELIDGTRLTAELIHYYDGTFTLRAAGKTIKLPKAKVRAIVVKLPDPRPEFATPRKTFDHWLAAVKQRDVKAMMDCYTLVYASVAAREFELLSDKAKAEMWGQIQDTTLSWLSVKTEGDRAVAKVEAKLGNEKRAGELNFVRENGDWKMTPFSLGALGNKEK